jgi:hypothetical protein
VLRKFIEAELREIGLSHDDVYFCSLSSATIVYKGQLTPEQVIFWGGGERLGQGGGVLGAARARRSRQRRGARAKQRAVLRAAGSAAWTPHHYACSLPRDARGRTTPATTRTPPLSLSLSLSHTHTQPNRRCRPTSPTCSAQTSGRTWPSCTRASPPTPSPAGVARSPCACSATTVRECGAACCVAAGIAAGCVCVCV